MRGGADTMIVTEGSLRVIRLPGEFGPIVRCAGDLTVDTAEILQRELAFLEPLGHPVLTLNLSDCTFLDSHGVLTLLTTFKRVRAEGRRLVVVAQGGFAARLLEVVGFDHVVPVFPDEKTTVLALRGGPP